MDDTVAGEATLILKDNIKGTRLFKTKKGTLPLGYKCHATSRWNLHSLCLKQPWFWSWWRHKRFEGDYILSLEGTCGKLVNGSRCNKR